MKMFKSIMIDAMDVVSQLRAALSLRSPIEKRLFWASLLSFVFISTAIVPFINYDANVSYLGYDTSIYFTWFQQPKLVPYMFFRHPFIKFILLPFVLFNYILQLMLQCQWVGWFMTISFNVIMSYCVLLMYKILYDIMQVSSFHALLLTLFFISFGHVLVLLAVLDSFLLSMFLLLITLYISGRVIALKQPVNKRLFTYLLLLTTGVTLTNGVKVGLAYLFIPSTVKQKVKWCLQSAIWFVLLFIPCFFLTKAVLAHFHPGKDFGFYRDCVSDSVGWVFKTDWITYLDMIYHHLLCEPLMLHTSRFYDFNPGINQGYALPLFHVAVALFYGLVAWGAVLAWKNKFVQLLLSFLLVDVLIHVVFRFGLDEGQIYCGHWMFLFPLLIANLFGDKRLEKYHSSLTGLLILMGCCFFSNNLFRLVQFMVSQYEMVFAR